MKKLNKKELTHKSTIDNCPDCGDELETQTEFREDNQLEIVEYCKGCGTTLTN